MNSLNRNFVAEIAHLVDNNQPSKSPEGAMSIIARARKGYS